jgi:hypothetical protein
LARVIVLIVILVVLVLAAGAVLVPRAIGLDPEWLARARHALGEARYRAGMLAAEFADFVRMGR